MERGMVKSAIRVFDLLELFENERRPMRVVEMVEKLELPQSSVSMLLQSLVTHGYMEFDAATRAFCPSVRVAFLGEWTTRRQGGAHSIHDAIRHLSSETGETVLLGRRNGIQVQYLSIIEAQHTRRRGVASGARRPMHRTAIGIMLLSRMDDDAIVRLLRRHNAEPPPDSTGVRLDDVMREVRIAREQGYYESASLATPGSGVIATLARTPIRGQWLGIGIGGTVPRLHERRGALLSALLAAASDC